MVSVVCNFLGYVIFKTLWSFLAQYHLWALNLLLGYEWWRWVGGAV
jgi:hypothetical protein